MSMSHISSLSPHPRSSQQNTGRLHPLRFCMYCECARAAHYEILPLPSRLSPPLSLSPLMCHAKPKTSSPLFHAKTQGNAIHCIFSTYCVGQGALPSSLSPLFHNKTQASIIHWLFPPRTAFVQGRHGGELEDKRHAGDNAGATREKITPDNILQH